MSKQRYDTVDATEDASKVGYSVVVFAAKAFYQVSGIEALKNSMDAYVLSRFSQRLEYFVHEHGKLSDKDKKNFYDSLSTNQQTLNYLYEFIEQARTTTFELHAKLLARLSVELINNKGLNYFQSTLLSNINRLNADDILSIYKFLKSEHESLQFIEDKTLIKDCNKIMFKVNTPEEQILFDKCLMLGVISIQNAFGFADKNVPLYSDRVCYFTRYSLEFYEMLDEIIND